MDIKEFSENYFKELDSAISQIDKNKIAKIVEIIYSAYKNNKQIFILGNGGSASTASHFACDLEKGTVKDFSNIREKRFKAISLADNVALITAIGNDLSYEDIFWQQLSGLLNEGDVVIGISASGNSLNVIKAIQKAKECGAKTIGLLGFKTGGTLHDLVDCEITIKDNNYGRVEDAHLILCHIIANYLGELKKNEYISYGQ
jgi:D-sedoheptulose 7-phosphate isomerase